MNSIKELLPKSYPDPSHTWETWEKLWEEGQQKDPFNRILHEWGRIPLSLQPALVEALKDSVWAFSFHWSDDSSINLNRAWCRFYKDTGLNLIEYGVPVERLFNPNDPMYMFGFDSKDSIEPRVHLASALFPILVVWPLNETTEYIHKIDLFSDITEQPFPQKDPNRRDLQRYIQIQTKFHQ